MTKNKKLIVYIRGVPGSGKSTHAKMMMESSDIDYVHYEADMFWEVNSIPFSISRIKESHSWCKDKVKQAIKDRKNIIVSNTFIEKWEFDEYQELLKGSKKYYQEQIVSLQSRWRSIHKVPPYTIADMIMRFENSNRWLL